MRETQLSVNCIIQYNKNYLFIKRSKDKDINPGVINILGGKVGPEENYAIAALREAREEVGDKDGKYISNGMEYKGTFIFRGGYKKDWIAQFYKFHVDSMDFPGSKVLEEGELFWANQDKFSELENVLWDLPYCWDVMIDDKLTFQIVAHLNEKEEPISLIKTVIHEDGYVVRTEKYDSDGGGGLKLVDTVVYK